MPHIYLTCYFHWEVADIYTWYKKHRVHKRVHLPYHVTFLNNKNLLYAKHLTLQHLAHIYWAFVYKLGQMGDISTCLSLSPSLPNKVEGVNSIPLYEKHPLLYAMPPNLVSKEGSLG